MCYERISRPRGGTPITRLRRAVAGGNLLAARAAASELPHVDLDEAAALLVLIARRDAARFDSAAVRVLGRACIERSFITTTDAQFLLGCLAQLARAGDESRVAFATALRRLRLERAASKISQGENWRRRGRRSAPNP